MSSLTRKGVNAQRHAFSGLTNHDDQLRDHATIASDRYMYRAVVVDVIYDPTLMMKEIVDAYADDIINASLLATAPRNSIIARLVSDAADKRSQSLLLFYPLFSHTHEPIKPGEKVWVIFESQAAVYELGYWISRIVERRDIDDPNFTHGDRAFIDAQSPSTIERADLGQSPPPGPGFPNGSDTHEGFTLAEPDGFEQIEKNAIANRVIVKEPVPRFNKRPGDWVAEGSNNSLLILGEDRQGPASDVQGGNIVGRPKVDKPSGGIFDLVVGRGLGPNRQLPAPNAKPQLTAPPVVKNARGLLETDKLISNENPSEGDVDFENDLAYVYGATDTDVDKNFGKSLPKLNAGVAPEVISAGSVVVAKSTNIRVLAREDGTIRIVKEGVEDDDSGKGRAIIIIEKDGTIMIDSHRMIIGSGIEKSNGAGTQLYLGRDASEPIVLGNVLKTLLTDYTNAIKTAVGKYVNSFPSVIDQMAASGPPSLGNFGLPIPGLVALANVMKTANLTFNQDVDKADSDLRSNVDKILSKIGKTK